MNKRGEEYEDEWFAKLDAIVTGKEALSSEDDDLLRMAAKLTDAFAPLSDLDGIHAQWHQRTTAPMSTRRQLLLRSVLMIAAVCFVIFGMVGACPASPQVSAATLNAGRGIWQVATSFEQIDASSVAILAVRKAGVRPLLPKELPPGTEAVAFGIITDGNDPRIFTAFVADYRIAGQDVSLYERPANLVFPSSAAQHIFIGTYKGQLFQDDMGNSILQWYQDGMTCQIASTLPVNELLAIARQLQPITDWELLV
ncbi:MAG: hypothetical protein ACR2H5_23125 [Ktedonobacteraceae bacterium]